MKKVFLVMLISFFLIGCSNGSGIDHKKLMLENEYVIVDVRTREEYELGHIEKAINIPYDELDENVDLDKEKIIFVYCKSGNRSKIAYNILKELDYTVYDLGAFTKIDLPREM